METGSYWTSALAKRLTRRRALGGAAMGVAVAALAACGGDDDGPKFKDASGLLTEAQDTTSKATPGGAWLNYKTTPATTNMDPLTSPGGQEYSRYSLSTLLRSTIGSREKPPKPGEVEGDAVGSWELSSDQLQYTLKLRPNVKYDHRPPTNGRLMDTTDVLYSWSRFSAGSGSQADLLNRLNPDAPVTAVEAPDKSTIVVKLAFPFAPMPSYFAHFRYFGVQPVEADGKFDPRNEVRGSGPFFMSEHVPSARVVFQRNPDWHHKGRPFLDSIVEPIISEYAQRLAQFRTKNLWTADVRPEDILATKRDVPKLQMSEDPAFPSLAASFLAYFQQPSSPFLDVRVRRAMAMVVDRPLWMEATNNISAFEKEGLAVDVRLNSHLAAGFEGFWLDPLSKEMGEGGAYFQTNQAEAKKLMQAAGYSSGLDVTFGYSNTAILRHYEILFEMLREGGLFKIREKLLDANSEWQPQCHRGRGNFEGMCGNLTAAPAATDPDSHLMIRFFSSDTEYTMFPKPLPKVQEMLIRQRRELDLQKRIGIVHDIQKELALQMPAMVFPFGLVRGHKLAWPWFGNFQALVGPANAGEYAYAHWYDKSKETV